MFACLHLNGRSAADAADGWGCDLLALAESLGPDVEIHGPETAIVDLTGWGGGRLPELSVDDVSLAVAGTPDLALIGALTGVGCSGRPLEPGDLDDLSIEWLESGVVAGAEVLLPVFRLWGVRTFGDFRRLPRQQTADRAGAAALRLHDVLHGRTCRPLRLHRPAERHVAGVGFEDPVCSLDALVFQIRRVLQTLCGGLAARHLAAGNIRMVLNFENHDPVERSIHLPAPLCSPEALLRPLEQVLENLRAPSGIVGFELELGSVAGARVQKGFWCRRLRRPECWPDTLARLVGLLGEGRVGVPEPMFSHRPDAFHVVAVAAVRPVESGVAVLPAVSVPLQRLRPPLVVAVASTRHGESSRPQAILNGPYAGQITGLRGPFSMSGDWWDGSVAWQRLEWDVAVDGHHLLRLARLHRDCWMVEGGYF